MGDYDFIDAMHDRWFAYLEEHPEIVTAAILAPKLSVSTLPNTAGVTTTDDAASSAINVPKI